MGSAPLRSRIKKACRKFGIPKWPFRTLTSKASRNRSSFQAINFHLSTINNSPPSASDTDQSSSDAEEAGVSSCEDDEEQAQQQPATRPVADEEECCSPLSVEDDGFAEFVNPSVSESAKGEFEQTMWAPAPLQIYTLEEAKESDLKSPKMRVSEDAYMSFLGSAFEEPTLESFDTELFDWNIGM